LKNLINLYTDELRERPVPYGFRWLVAALLVTAGLLLVYGLWTQQRLDKMLDEQQRLQARQQTLNASIAALEGQIVKKDRLEAMERELARLRLANTQREMLITELQGRVQQPAQGFARSLRGLASAHAHGVWLTHIQLIYALEKDGKTPSMDIRLTGRMQQGQQLPRYMDALAEVDVFQGLRFNSMQAARLDENGRTIAFLISTRPNDQLETVRQEQGP